VHQDGVIWKFDGTIHLNSSLLIRPLPMLLVSRRNSSVIQGQFPASLNTYNMRSPNVIVSLRISTILMLGSWQCQLVLLHLWLHTFVHLTLECHPLMSRPESPSVHPCLLVDRRLSNLVFSLCQSND
jgi:hypothetical protein